MKRKQMTRAEFLKLGAGASLWAAGGCVGFPAITSVRSPNGLLRHACIGTGNMAWWDIGSFSSHPKAEMAAFCDVDSDYLAKVKEKFPKAHYYRDWRELLEKEGDAIDSMNITIPDHNHVIVAAAAMRAGKHIYLQKPLCKTHREAEFLRDLAVESKVVTQMGAQHTAGMADRHTVAILQSGVLGPVKHAYFFSTRKGLSRRRRHLPPAVKAPATLDWNLWLGTAAERPYAHDVYHPLIWRVWRDLGSGWIGDIGCHLMSAVWTGMKLGKTAPKTIVAETATNCDPAVANLVWPTATHLTWTFDGVEASGGEPFVWDWYDGCSDADELAPAQFRPSQFIDSLCAKTPLKGRPYEGKVIECRDGWIVQAHAHEAAYIVRKDGTVQEGPKLPPVPTHFHEFIDACLEGRKAKADFDWATWLMETILTGEVAERLAGVKLAWDAKTRTFDYAPANKFLTETYRDGWQVAGL